MRTALFNQYADAPRNASFWKTHKIYAQASQTRAFSVLRDDATVSTVACDMKEKGARHQQENADEQTPTPNQSSMHTPSPRKHPIAATVSAQYNITLSNIENHSMDDIDDSTVEQRATLFVEVAKHLLQQHTAVIVNHNAMHDELKKRVSGDSGKTNVIKKLRESIPVFGANPRAIKFFNGKQEFWEGPSISNSDCVPPFYQNGAKSGFEICFLVPVSWVLGPKHFSNPE